MDTRDTRLAQIASIADAEPIGSVLFFAHLGLLMLAAVGAYVLFGHPEFLGVYTVYASLLTVEKLWAQRAGLAGNVSQYPVVLALLFARAVAFNVLVLLVWRLEGDVFKMAALALLVAATINIMVFHATFRAIIACVVVPIAMAFAAIALLIVLQEGWTPASAGAVAVLAFTTPYFALALSAAQQRWQELSSTRSALEQAQRMDAIGKVASGISHDFNNILSVISGNLHFLQTETDPAARSALLRSARNAIEGGASLSRQLLTMGKQQTLMPEAVSLDAVITTFVVFCRNVFPASIEVRPQEGGADITVHVDPNLLQSALLNLALNAKAAMKHGGVLTVSHGVSDPPADKGRNAPGPMAYIELVDTGIGMSPAAVERAFEPFYSTRAATGGSGLGLPMVKGFVEQSKGHVTLDSREGGGTTVRVYLPLATPQQRAAKPAEDTEPATDIPQTGLVRILLVEDNFEMRRILQTMLERSGYEVAAFDNADEAATHLLAHPGYRLVLCDFDLPGQMQGDDLLAFVKSQNRQMRFILMSGYAPTETFADTEKLSQADLFLPKPIRLEDLRWQVEVLLEDA